MNVALLDKTAIEKTRVREFLTHDRLPFFIGGTWLASSESVTFPTLDPGTGELLADVSEATRTVWPVTYSNETFWNTIWPRSRGVGHVPGRSVTSLRTPSTLCDAALGGEQAPCRAAAIA